MIYKIHAICDLIAGFAFKSKDFGNYSDKVIKIADIQPPIVNMKSTVGVDTRPYDINKLQKFIVAKGDYVLAMTGATIGKLGRITSDCKAYINQRVLTFRPNEQIVNKDYLYYSLCSNNFTKYILNHIDSETAQPNISAGSVGGFEISLPSLGEQRRIVDILIAIDRKIEINKRINDNLEQQAQALYKSWFVDFEPFKDGKFEESEIGLIPEGWCVGKAEDFYEINIGKTPPRKEHEWFTLDKSQNIWVSISDLGSDSRFIFDSSEYLTDKAIQKHNIVLVPENTVLLSFKLTIGRVGIAGTQLTTNEAIARFITNSINREYTYFLLKNFNYSKLGSTSSIATAVNSKIIKAMMVLMPNNECLHNFKKLVGPIIDGIKKNEEEILRLTELRDNLLPKLMSGELKINEIDC